MPTIPADYLAKLRAHLGDRGLAVGHLKEEVEGAPAGSVWIADVALNSIGYIRREGVADLIIMLWNDYVDSEDEAVVDHICGATGLRY